MQTHDQLMQENIVCVLEFAEEEARPGAPLIMNCPLPVPPAAVSLRALEGIEFETMIRLIIDAPDVESILPSLHEVSGETLAAVFQVIRQQREDQEQFLCNLFEYLRILPILDPLSHICNAGTFTVMIQIAVKQQDVQQAFEFFYDMHSRGLEPGIQIYNSLMEVCIKNGTIDTSVNRLPLLALIAFNAAIVSGCVPDVTTFHHLVEAYGMMGLWEAAIEVIPYMKTQGIEPVLCTYNSIMIVCNTCNQPHLTLDVAVEMCAKGMVPDIITLNAMISANGAVGQLEEALEIYNAMTNRSVLTYTAMMNACEKAGDWARAMRIFIEMKDDNCILNTAIYNSLIMTLGSSRQEQGCEWELSQKFFEQMPSRGCIPDSNTYTALIRAFLRGRQWEKAKSTYTKMQEQGLEPSYLLTCLMTDTNNIIIEYNTVSCEQELLVVDPLPSTERNVADLSEADFELWLRKFLDEVPLVSEVGILGDLDLQVDFQQDHLRSQVLSATDAAVNQLVAMHINRLDISGLYDEEACDFTHHYVPPAPCISRMSRLPSLEL